jgi:N-methylhydantoinase B/oxoprolinase/acetone carboxylase alpha subunit
VDDVVVVHILKTNENATDEELYDVLWESAIFADLVAKVSATHEVHDEVKVLTVLKGIDHVHEKWMAQLGEEFTLI